MAYKTRKNMGRYRAPGANVGKGMPKCIVLTGVAAGRVHVVHSGGGKAARRPVHACKNGRPLCMQKKRLTSALMESHASEVTCNSCLKILNLSSLGHRTGGKWSKTRSERYVLKGGYGGKPYAAPAAAKTKKVRKARKTRTVKVAANRSRRSRW